MPVVITLDMYSGLPNPSWELDSAQAEHLMKILSKDRDSTNLQSPASAGRLGYRGMTISSSPDSPFFSTMHVFDGVLASPAVSVINTIDQGSEVESFLLGTAGLSLKEEEVKYVEQEISKNSSGGIGNSFRALATMTIPPFDPAKWNNDPTILRSNNCYNYGNDKITNTFAQPGRGSGQEGPYPPSCSETGAAAQRDGQLAIPNPDFTPAQGHIIALVVSTTPGFLDYHWYRRDSNLMWSHKPGQTPARNTDNSGRPISDPRTCDRGPYNNFCGFYHCIPSNTRIR